MDPRKWFTDLTPYFLYLILVSTIGPLLFGFHLSELNTPEAVIKCEKKSIGALLSTSLPQCIPMNPTQWGAVSSMLTLGGLLGALAAGPLGSRYGRLNALFVTTIFFIIGPVFEAATPNIAVFAIGRFITGIGVGATVNTVPIYISEIAPPDQKGFFGSLTQVMVNVGILITQLLGFFLSHGQLWRIVLGAGGLIGLVQLGGLFFAVESPKWLADQGKPSQAKRDLRKIRGHEANIEEEVKGWGIEGQEEMEDEEQTLLQNEDRMPEHSGTASKRKEASKEVIGILGVLRHPDHHKAIIAVVMVMLAQQLTGINSIIMYGVNLLSDLLESNSALLNLGVSALNIIVTLAGAPLVDKLGRKTCLLNSLTFMGIAALLLGIGITRKIAVLSAVSVALFVCGFGLGLGPIPFILSSELVGQEAVGATQSWALASNWIGTFLVAQFFPIAKDALGGNVYFIFAGIAVFFWLFIAWYVPETKGKKTADEVWSRDHARED